ncbi:MAG: T6SS immunity protein Tli4 family protein [Candidatus Binatia bacterium]
MHVLNIKPSSSRLRLVVVSVVIVLLAGCDPAPVRAGPVLVDGEDATPSKPPTAEQIRAATAPEYKSPPGLKQECFGRLVFDVGGQIEWPVFYDANTYSLFDRSFSNNVADRGDQIRFGNTRVAVIASVNGVSKEKVLEWTPSASEVHFKTLIEERRAAVGKMLKKGVKTEQDRWRLDLAEEAIRAWEKAIKDDQENFESFHPGLPNSEGYWTSRIEAGDEKLRYSVLRAYLTRGDFMYVFESSQKMLSPADKDAHKKDFTAMLTRFRARAPNEIPTELGVCVPFGFIPDDGTTVTEFKQSLRFADAPGVLYTLQTGNVHPRRLKLPPLLAMANASISPPASTGKGQTQAVVAQRIGPRSHKIGALTGEQGGVVWKATRPNGEKHDIYSVFTGYSGWLGTAVLPYILVDMRTVTKDHAAELKQNPPPFEQSMERLELLLKSTRLRPTNPPMPELVNR